VPKTKADQEKMHGASTMAIEDPCSAFPSPEPARRSEGYGRASPDIKVDILVAHGVDANVGAPQVAHHETLVRSTTRLHA
jgi:translation elongation factor EF-G